MNPKMWAGVVMATLGSAASAQGQVNMLCSVQAEWCTMLATVYTRTTGTRVNVAQKGSGEAYRTVGIYSGPLGFGYNSELLARKKIPVPKTWADLVKPEYKGDVGAYPRSGTAPIKAVARGETAVSISFVHDGPGEKMQGYPVETITPTDGTGAGIGSMSLVKGARNLEAAKKFYEWALTPAAQEMAAASKSFQLPSNKAAKLDPQVPDFKKIRMIDYDYAKYGASAERRRLIARWEKEVDSLPR